MSGIPQNINVKFYRINRRQHRHMCSCFRALITFVCKCFENMFLKKQLSSSCEHIELKILTDEIGESTPPPSRRSSSRKSTSKKCLKLMIDKPIWNTYNNKRCTALFCCFSMAFMMFVVVAESIALSSSSSSFLSTTCNPAIHIIIIVAAILIIFVAIITLITKGKHFTTDCKSMLLASFFLFFAAIMDILFDPEHPFGDSLICLIGVLLNFIWIILYIENDHKK